MWQTSAQKILEGHSECLKKLIEDHEKRHTVISSLRSRCIDGSTLLHVAAYFGEHQHIETLLQLQVDVDILDYKGATPLQRSRDEKTMQLLLKYGAEVNWRDDDGNTALHMVCYGETGKPTRMDCLGLLFSQGGSTRKCNKKGLLPVHCAAIQGRHNAIQAVFESGIKETEFINKHSYERDTPSLPYLALSNGHLECTKWLISNGFLLKDREDIELLLDMVCNKDDKKNNLESVEYLLSNGLDVNICDKRGDSVLHLAALQIKSYEIMKLLLSFGAQVNLTNHDGITPLFNTVFASNFHGARLLIDCGASLKHQDNEDQTAFDHVKNTEDWIECGIFSNEINDLLRAYDLRKSVQLVRQVANKVKMKGAVH
ncbi:serine/threonine-protein phosphatase 6 regulatory ankyrin repeat subunit B-like [Rana temporaria]|uniref:serine/threonine-protein phosphatase 6 regulatory ankyrin repeat subunit B-like n=1 Tax=Rana temporaria TaxID=8407 RepID=UPI001AAC8813|nr:serine/threonine-protein phosphatase 6 regulatory ankyrin repeat subunit B-like [Rana temporaria]